MQNKVFLLLIFAKIDRKSMKKWKKILDRTGPAGSGIGCISGSKTDLSRQGFTDFQQELPLFPLVLMEMLTHSDFRKLQFHM